MRSILDMRLAYTIYRYKRLVHRPTRSLRPSPRANTVTLVSSDGSVTCSAGFIQVEQQPDIVQMCGESEAPLLQLNDIEAPLFISILDGV